MEKIVQKNSNTFKNLAVTSNSGENGELGERTDNCMRNMNCVRGNLEN